MVSSMSEGMRLEQTRWKLKVDCHSRLFLNGDKSIACRFSTKICRSRITALRSLYVRSLSQCVACDPRYPDCHNDCCSETDTRKRPVLPAVLYGFAAR